MMYENLFPLKWCIRIFVYARRKEPNSSAQSC